MRLRGSGRAAGLAVVHAVSTPHAGGRPEPGHHGVRLYPRSSSTRAPGPVHDGSDGQEGCRGDGSALPEIDTTALHPRSKAASSQAAATSRGWLRAAPHGPPGRRRVNTTLRGRLTDGSPWRQNSMSSASVTDRPGWRITHATGGDGAVPVHRGLGPSRGARGVQPEGRRIPGGGVGRAVEGACRDRVQHVHGDRGFPGAWSASIPASRRGRTRRPPRRRPGSSRSKTPAARHRWRPE